MATKKTMKLEVCLYGAQHCGFGWLATGPGKLEGGKALGKSKMFGTGEISKGVSSATEALWLALEALKSAGAPNGNPVGVHAPGGQVAAFTEVGSCKAFGDLKWSTAPVYVVSAAEVMAAAEKGGK